MKRNAGWRAGPYSAARGTDLWRSEEFLERLSDIRRIPTCRLSLPTHTHIYAHARWNRGENKKKQSADCTARNRFTTNSSYFNGSSRRIDREVFGLFVFCRIIGEEKVSSRTF